MDLISSKVYKKHTPLGSIYTKEKWSLKTGSVSPNKNNPCPYYPRCYPTTVATQLSSTILSATYSPAIHPSVVHLLPPRFATAAPPLSIQLLALRRRPFISPDAAVDQVRWLILPSTRSCHLLPYFGTLWTSLPPMTPYRHLGKFFCN